MMIRPTSISLSPNTEPDDIWAAFVLLFQPWRWKRGGDIEKFEQEFGKYMGVSHAVSFNSGRSAFLAILESLGLRKEDEILIQAFTCNAVPNPVLWAGFTPVYVDCKEDYNMDAADLERKVTLRQVQGKLPRAVVVQHTFGLPADMEKIQEVCNRRNLILLEDCAHALGALYKGKKVGTFGKAAFFSFSRDKVISSVYGGMATTNDTDLAVKLKEYQKNAGYPSLFWTKQQLSHPTWMNWVILPTYLVFGKYLLRVFQWLHVLSKAVHWKEKRGERPGYFPKALPNALAILALRQLQKLDRFNAHRREIAALYSQALSNTSYKLPFDSFDFAQDKSAQGKQAASLEREHIFLRFPVRHEKAGEILRKAWDKNLLLGDWYTTPIAPHDTNIEKMGYAWGSCPNAEALAKTTLNLPTHIRISKKDANIIVTFLKSVQTV